MDKPIRPFSRSMFMTLTGTIMPSFIISLTRSTRNGAISEMCTMPSAKGFRATNAPKSAIFTTLPLSISPTLNSWVISSTTALANSVEFPLPVKYTVPSSSMVISAPDFSLISLIVFPPPPITRPILLWSILIIKIFGALGEMFVRGFGISASIFSIMARRAVLDCFIAS